MRGAASAAILALLLAACAEEWANPLLPPDAEMPPAAATAPGATAPLTVPTDPGVIPPPAVTTTPDAPPTAGATEPGPELAAAAGAPHIYMALQPDPAGPTSVVLAIDRSRDNTPSDDPAIRITPVDGQCNPQQLRWHDFPPERARRPSYGPEEAAGGVTARELPDFMATAVTSEMMAAGLVDGPEDSQPQNVCTRKLLQRMIIDRSAAGAS